MPPKKLLILGATGATGVLTVDRALVEGHSVIVFARSPEKLSAAARANPNLKIFEGELSDSAALSAAFAERPDAVVSLLGPTAGSVLAPWKIGSTFTDAYRSVLGEMRARGVGRILVMGTLSIYDARDKASFVRSVLVWMVYLLSGAAYRQIIAINELFRKEAGDLEWTIFRLGILGDGPVGETAVGYVGDGKTRSGVHRAELAEWLVEEAARERAEWVRECPVVSSAGKGKTK